MMRMLALLQFEWTKMTGRRITWVPFIMLALIVALVVMVFYKVEFKMQRKLFDTAAFTFQDKSEFVNGYFMTAHAMNPIFQMLIPIFVAVASGLMLAGEAEHGTLRACLIRPVTRRRLILSKFVMLSSYAFAISVFIVALLAGAGIVNFGTGNLYTLNLFFNNGQDGASMVPAGEMPLRLALAAVIATLGMMVLSALALLISALVDTAAMAYVITLSVYFAFLTLRTFPFLDWLYPYLFVTHMHRWQQCFYSHIRTGEILVSVVHLAAYAFVFLAAAVLLFEERDIKT